MSVSSAPVPGQPGWYPDPMGRFEARYCMRGRWTNRVRCGDAEAVDAQPLEGSSQPDDVGTTWQQAAIEGAGWAPDPTGRFDERWWDGQRYTRRIRWGHAVGTDTVSPPSAGGSGSARRATSEAARADAPAPGWYPDPQGEGERFWDGHVWTAKWRAGTSAQDRDAMRGWMPQSVIRGIAAVGIGIVLIALLAILVAVVA